MMLDPDTEAATVEAANMMALDVSETWPFLLIGCFFSIVSSTSGVNPADAEISPGLFCSN